MEQKAIIQEGITHQKLFREIRRHSNKTNPDNIIGPKVVHNAKYKMHNASNPDTSNRVNVVDGILAVLNKFNDSSFNKEVITTNHQKTQVSSPIQTNRKSRLDANISMAVFITSSSYQL
jgi:hypothetical protein